MTQAGKAFHHFVPGGVLLVLLVLAVGCQGPAVSEGFERIELGKPLPAELPAGMERTPLGAGYVGSIDPDSQSNTNANMRIMNVLTDDTGNVAAKSYLAMKLSHCILFLAGSYTYIIELDVPAEAFKNTTKTWKVPTELLLISQDQTIGIALRGKDLFEAASQPGNDDKQAEPVVTLADMKRRANIFLLIMREGVRTMEQPPECGIFDLECVFEKIGKGITAGAEVEKRLRALPAHEPVKYSLANVPEAVLYYRILLGGTMRNEPADEKCPAGNLMSIYTEWVSGRVMELLTDRKAFSGVTQEQYDKSVPTLDGMRLRVRSLGGRRVRVEISGTVIRDPIIAPLMLVN